MAQILLIDDDPAVRDYLKDILAAEGHAVDLASDGRQGLGILENKRYDLVIVDRHMPKMSGLELVVAARRNPALKDVKIMMCTSAGTLTEIDEAFQAGATDYLVKPIETARLLQKVARHLAPPPPRP